MIPEEIGIDDLNNLGVACEVLDISDGPMDIETAIRTCTSSAGEDGREELYDLSGRRVARAGKGGIYLMRGKKIVK